MKASQRMERLNLEEAVAALPDFARSLGLPVPGDATFATLRSVLDAPPPGPGKPRVASDTEGCIIVVWRGDGPAVLGVTLEGDTVNATVRPGERSIHWPAFRWDGAWPARLLDAVACRAP